KFLSVALEEEEYCLRGRAALAGRAQSNDGEARAPPFFWGWFGAETFFTETFSTPVHIIERNAAIMKESGVVALG
ncbi:MAG: hypothetical protein AAB967_02300, partial [Patescibacteria group bacterium]